MSVSDEVRAAAKKRAEDMTATNWYKLKGGQGEAIDNTFRILRTPPTKKHKLPWIDYAIHREVGPNKKTVRCGRDPVSHKGECYLCDVYIPKLKKQGRDSTATLLAARPVFLVQVAEVKFKEDGSMIFRGPFLFTPNKNIASKLLSDVISGGRGKRDYLDPENGYNITIPRIGTGFKDTSYGVMQVDPESSTVPESILKKLKPFEELEEIQAYSEAKQKAALQGGEAPTGDDETPRRAKKVAVDEDEDEDADVPEDEDEDEDADTEDEDEDEAPAPKKKKKPVKRSDDDDSDDGDEEDEDEETAPKKKSKKKVEEDDEDADEDEGDDDEPAPKKKPAAKKKAAEEDDDDADDPDDDEDEEPAPKKKKPAAKKKPPVEDEDDGDEEEDDEDADDEPAPKKKPAAKKKAAEEDEDEEDDADEDADDDVPPPPKRRLPPPPKKRK